MDAIVGLVCGAGVWTWLGLWRGSWWQIASSVLMGGALMEWHTRKLFSDPTPDPTTTRGAITLASKFGVISGVGSILLLFGMTSLMHQPLTNASRIMLIQTTFALGLLTAISWGWMILRHIKKSALSDPSGS